jgi:uncharacterized protein
MSKPIALVTGASSGLGIDFARQLGARGYDLALTARSADAMQHVRDEIVRNYGCNVTIHPMDLSRDGSARELCSQLRDAGIAVDVLVNNAGFGLAGKFLDNDLDQLSAMFRLNIGAATELAHVIGSEMAARRRGHILFVASMAAFQPSPLLAVYAGTKAYIVSLSEALNVEFAPANVTVTVLSPGLMNTGFNAVAGYETSAKMQKYVLPTDRVAETGLDALFAGRSSVVAGKANSAMAFATRFFSRHFLAKQMGRISGKG